MSSSSGDQFSDCDSSDYEFSDCEFSSDFENFYDDQVSWELIRELILIPLIESARKSNRKNLNVPCKFYLQGNCKQGNYCRFSHNVEVPPSNPKRSIPCKFFAQGKCLKGDTCDFFHSNHPLVPEPQVRSTSNTIDHPCSICLENIVQNEKKFGLLSGCNHVFCMDCIKKWRNSTVSSVEATKSCPICRKPSYYIIPSPCFVTEEEKKTIDVAYKERMKHIPCKYFTSANVCPFGSNCFYEHL